MDNPLGSFPRFGHQERWAIERRQRAMENSFATRQASATRKLMVEQEVYLMLDGYMQSMRPNCPQTRAMADEILKRMNRIKRKHDAGQRVYFRFLEETVQLFCRSFFPENDYATFALCEFNNRVKKPPSDFVPNYIYNRSAASGQKLRKYSDLGTTFEYYITNHQEAMAYACTSWGKAAGAWGATRGKIGAWVDFRCSVTDKLFPHRLLLRL